MSISRAFQRQDQRQRWKAGQEKQRAREAALHRRTELVSQLGVDRREDAWLLIKDKHEELHGCGFYSTEQIEEINAAIASYTPDEFDAAVALAKALDWEEESDDFDIDYHEQRVAQRRLQGRGPAVS